MLLLGHGQHIASTPIAAGRHVLLVPQRPHISSAAGLQPRRRLSPTVTATPRRRVNRELLDNVDTTDLDGIPGNGLQRPGPGVDEYGSGLYNNPASSPADAQPSSWDADNQSPGVATGPYDDPYSWLPDPQGQHQHPSAAEDSRGATAPHSSSGYGGYEEYGSNNYPTDSNTGRQPATNGAQTPSYPASLSPSPAAASAASVSATVTGRQQQHLRQRRGQRDRTEQQGGDPKPPHTDADWGEPDPLTDWGGFAAAGSTGWDEDDDTATAASASYDPQSGAYYASSAPRDSLGGGFGSSTGWDGSSGSAGSNPASSSSSGRHHNGAADSSKAWPRPSEGAAAGGTGQEPDGTGVPNGWSAYGSPPDGWADARFAQDVEYDGGGGSGRGG
ncbi:hypothetical protein Agub_g8619, partial [Astrephomene gubernaculifera]